MFVKNKTRCSLSAAESSGDNDEEDDTPIAYITAVCRSGRASIHIAFHPSMQIVRQDNRVTITRGSLLYGTPTPTKCRSQHLDKDRRRCCHSSSKQASTNETSTKGNKTLQNVEEKSAPDCPEFGILLSKEAINNPEKHFAMVDVKSPEQTLQTALGRLLSTSVLQGIGFRISDHQKSVNGSDFSLEDVVLHPHASTCSSNPAVYAVVRKQDGT